MRVDPGHRCRTQSRDFHPLGNLLRSALADTHDEAGLDALQKILLMFDLALEGRLARTADGFARVAHPESGYDRAEPCSPHRT